MKDHNKKILITAFDFFPQTGGVATYAWELAESLGRQGYKVRVVAKRREGTPARSPHFEITYLHLKNSGFASFPSLAFHLRGVLKSWAPDKIICTLWMPGAIACCFARLFQFDKPDIFVVVHAMEILDPQKNWKGWLRRRLFFLKRWTFNNMKKTFCVSHFSRDLLLAETGISKEKVYVVNNGVNAEKFCLKDNIDGHIESFEDHYPLFFTVARLVPHKGIDTMIRSLPEVLQKHPKAKYLIGGTGPDRQRLENLVDELNIRRAVEFLGFVSQEELPQLYRLADIFVLLSREMRPHVEGFGLVFLEAAACGTPSLGGRSGGIPDAIIEGQTGWLVDPEKPLAVARTLKTILKTPGAIEQMGQQAYAYTIKNRQWSHVSQTISSHLFGP